jgi:hypothetical protein
MPNRRCLKCDTTYPQTLQYFYHHPRSGWSSWCRACKCANERQRYHNLKSPRVRQINAECQMRRAEIVAEFRAELGLPPKGTK